ncbi:MAG: hypothetical protein AAF357_00055 [Verrucomicrobiota bacterium]
MSDPSLNCTLDLACTVGSISNAHEALAEGADVNHSGGAPLFLAIMNRNRGIIEMLLDHGAEADAFVAKKRLKLVKNREDLVEELIACAPYNPRDVSLESIEEIDSAIRESGVGFLVSSLDWDHATRFRDTLDAIGAGGSHRCVAEFLHWARAESREAEEGLDGFLESFSEEIVEYRDRYLSTGENLVALARDYIGED